MRAARRVVQGSLGAAVLAATHHGCGGLRGRAAAQLRGFTTSSTLLGRLVPYKLADIGEGITEVQVLTVRVKPGDHINEFDAICEVQSDKATVEITSRYTGVVKAVHVATGQTAHVGQPIIDIEAEDDSHAAPPTTPAPAAPASTAGSAPTAASGTAIPYKLADIGEGITEVQVLAVRVKPGDVIHEFDPICEVQSDKATVEITSRYTGVVKAVHLQTGTAAKVGSVMLDIVPEGPDDAPPAATPSAGAAAAPHGTGAAPTQPPQQQPQGATAAGKVLATPATRYLAREHHIELARVTPTGKGGRVTKDDVLRFLAGGHAAAPASAVPPPTPTPPTPAATAAPGVPVAGLSTEAGDTVVPITGVRRGMVKTMTQAASIPTFTFSEEYELTRLMGVRASLKEVVAERSKGKAKLSFMPFFLKAASIALQQHPDINAHCPPDCSALVRKGAHNIGFAMDTPNGLIVPVVPHVEQKSILDIAMEMQALIERGKHNKLTTQDMTGGTFTLSNIGAIGATTTKPVLLPPQVAIGAIGRLQTLPRFDKKGNVYAANLVCISFTADHRVIDGASMVRFANTYKWLLENPENMLVDLR